MVCFARAGLRAELGSHCQSVEELLLARERPSGVYEARVRRITVVAMLIAHVGWEAADIQRPVRVDIRAHGDLLLEALQRQLQAEMNVLEKTHGQRYAVQRRRVKELRLYLRRLGLMGLKTRERCTTSVPCVREELGGSG
jgi:hypothetical protein